MIFLLNLVITLVNLFYASGNIQWEIFPPSVKEIDFSDNSYEGSTISPQIGRLHNLTYINLIMNDLIGALPSTIGNLSYLKTILLHTNKLSGEIPSSICQLASLEFLHMSNNTLEGPIPQCLGNLSKSLQVLHLKENHLHGFMPSSFAKECVLVSFNLNSNQFGGKLSRSFENCRQLQVLDVGNNEIEDVFPFWSETLLDLRVLVLKSNRFFGSILPPSESSAPFPKLQVFDIAQNAFTGSLPDKYLNSFTAMIDVKENVTERDWFVKYDESMAIVIKGLEQQVERILTTFTTIDMSNNDFSGNIPESMAKLNSLRYLNLSFNNLAGHIPPSIGSMITLESLDLSSNQLDGEIPGRMTDLTFLAKLNLSMNNLVGRIPHSHQFNTFENDSFVGNEGLCGLPLTRKCEKDDGGSSSGKLPDEDEDDDDDFLDGLTWVVVFLGYGCGVAISFSMTYFMFKYGWPIWLMKLCIRVEYKIEKIKRSRRRVRRNEEEPWRD